jgi:hypothetical protein
VQQMIEGGQKPAALEPIAFQRELAKKSPWHQKQASLL